MKCREKLKQEHPEKIDSESWGGCEGCPSHYGYLDNPDYCGTACEADSLNERCTKCWDREIPDTKEEAIKKMAECYGCSYGEAEKIINIQSCYTDGTEKIAEGRGKRREVPGIIDEAVMRTNAFGISEKDANGAARMISEAWAKSLDNEPKTTLLPYKPGAIGIGVSPTWDCTEPKIKDSGNRREFETGAVRDIQEGKGRCDLLPLDVVGGLFGQIYGRDHIPARTLMSLALFTESGDRGYLYHTLSHIDLYNGYADMFLEVSKHFEEGANKYGEYNWQKGIPTHCYIDSAVRHYLKYLRGDKDEPHDRAFVWNILCCIWTCIHKPELNDYRPVVEKKKRSKREIMERRAQLNEERKKRLGTKG